MWAKHQQLKYVCLIAMITSVTVIIYNESILSQSKHIIEGGKSLTKKNSLLKALGLDQDEEKSSFNNWRKLSTKEIRKLSVLGRRLFLHEDIGKPKNKTFTILAWKTGHIYENRLLQHFSGKYLDPFENCSVSNCIITYNESALDSADALFFQFHIIDGPPVAVNRSRLDQFWVWLSDESPLHTFMVSQDKNISHYNGFYNWSMTYRMDSDVPVPYGRTVPLASGEVVSKMTYDVFPTKSKTIAYMGSNCGGINHRQEYIMKLKEYIPDMDMYGGCGTLQCMGHFAVDCKPLILYKFYIAFENSNCKEYITEKAWWNAFHKDSVPVVMGTKKSDYEKFFPPNSFIYAEDFESPKDLAKYILYLASNRTAYNKYHEWRLSYKVVNEHGYFNSPIFHYCRLCEALNYNSHKRKILNNLERFWSVERDCYPPIWKKNLQAASHDV